MPQTEEFEVVLVSGGDDAGYSVFVPALPGCASEGEDRDEALYMVQGAIELFLEEVGRPAMEETEDAEQMKKDWTTQGYTVQTASVLVNLNAGIN
ncbi:MAG: type II toxin-antitoxin system HicB family antitoxin [Chloroflexota bacterium]|nr:type II toxin-antitoxin system HicB family antitoxin [Chloroflexota bacterium]MDE2959453.1 type II toxin-antitoxin system HicB family antitoxin [Chloroflexota bacterium]